LAQRRAERVRSHELHGRTEIIKRGAGYLEAFANLYAGLGGDASPLGKQATVGDRAGIPTTHDGLKGFAFVDAVINNSESNSVWRRRSRHSPEIPVGYPMRLLDSIFPSPLECSCS